VVLAAVVIYLKANVPVSEFHPMVFGEAESAFRHALFQVVSVITTTGFVTADFTSWTPFLTILFFILMFLGGSSGSTSGGIKVMRHILIIKNGLLEFKRTMHTNAIIPVRYNNKTVQEHIVYNIIGFLVLYMLLFVVGSLVLGALGLDFVSAIGGAASSLGNVGPAFGDLNPVSNYNSLPSLGKWWCGILMLLGRLELFTVLILFSPHFWKRT
ncbi:MAG: potassium transporter TrkG, partial [Arenibacter sp.]|nr:potassium transporter TrkG [Arenibacter sp.]